MVSTQPYGPLTIGSTLADQSTVLTSAPMSAAVVQEAAGVAGWEDVVVRVPAKQQRKTIMVPGPVITRPFVSSQEVIQRVQERAPETFQKILVQGPPAVIVRKVAVQGPAREVVRRVEVRGPPREVVQKVQVQGPPKEIIKRVEVQGPPREVIRNVAVPGPPTVQEVKVQIAKPGSPREIERKVAVPRDVIRDVVRTVNVEQIVPTPVPVMGPAQEVIVRVRDDSVYIEHERLKNELQWLRAQHALQEQHDHDSRHRQPAHRASASKRRRRARHQHEEMEHHMYARRPMPILAPLWQPPAFAPYRPSGLVATIGGYNSGVLAQPVVAGPMSATFGGYQTPLHRLGSMGGYTSTMWSTTAPSSSVLRA